MMNCQDLSARFEETFLRLTGGDGAPVLAALSGGADSTALLLLLDGLRQKTPFPLGAMYVEHGLRGEESLRDEAFCRRLCEQRGIRFISEHIDVQSFAKAQKKSVEESARILRYQALEREAARNGAYIATAHHAGDQLETMLFRIARGCGSAGLAGIPEKRGRILRPLLRFTKEELICYLSGQGQDYMTDSTNDEDFCARNILRHRAVPAMREVCSAAERNAARLAVSAAEDEAFLRSLLPDRPPDAEGYRALPAPLRRRLTARVYGEYRQSRGLPAAALESSHIEALDALITGGLLGKSVSLPGGVSATFCKTGWSFRQKDEPGIGRLPLRAGENPLGDGKRSVYLMNGRQFSEFSAKYKKIHTLFTKAALNSATIEGELFVRGVQPGDRMRSGGMTHSLRKLLQEVCPDAAARSSYPLICDGAGVLWLPGRAPRDRSIAGRELPEQEKIYLILGETGYELS